MSNITDFLGSSGKILGPTLTVPIFSSRTWVAPQDGYVIVGAIGAGGSGAKGGGGTGGYSGAWGMKIIRVLKGDTITVVIGVGGAAPTAVGPGNAGTATTITIAGITYTAPGGYAGVYVASGTPTVPSGASLPAGWDIGANSVKPGAANNAATGGAGVDILAQGNDATTSDSSAASAGGGTGGPSVALVGGGAYRTAASTGQPAASPPVYFDASQGEWGISFYGGSGGVSSGQGGNGGGGGSNTSGSKNGDGGNGGGGAGGNSSIASGAGGLGAGSGAVAATPAGATGGNGFACIRFFADMGLS